MSIPDRKIRVLYVIDKMIRAGAQNHLRQVITGLDPRGFQPFLCCLLYKGPLAEELEDMGYHVESLQLNNIMGLNFFRAVRGLYGIIRRHRIDLVHAYLFAANIVSPVAGLFSRIPVISSRRDTGFWKTSRHISAHRVINLLTVRITANSQAVADYLLTREKVKKEKIILINNGLKLPPLRPDPDTPGGTDGRFIIGMMGNIRPVKGYEYLLRAAVRLNSEYSFDIHIAGRILDRDYYNKLTTFIADNHLEDWVNFRGEIAAAESFFRELDIFILPSLSEGSSNALLEAMGNGLAVIATSVGGNKEMIHDGEDGFLVKSGDSDELEVSWRKLMDSPGLIPILGASARRRVSEEFSSEKMCRKLEDLYRECINLRFKKS